jgi:uncharacterized protein DUF5615
MDRGQGLLHVSDLGFSSADDKDIWSHAKSNDFIIISKDEDFADLCVLDSEPASVIWLRIRNCSKRALLCFEGPAYTSDQKRRPRRDATLVAQAGSKRKDPTS